MIEKNFLKKKTMRPLILEYIYMYILKSMMGAIFMLLPSEEAKPKIFASITLGPTLY